MIEKIKKLVIKKFQNQPNRLNHIMSVNKTSIELAIIYNESLEKTQIAALFHDYTKYDSVEKQMTYLEDTIIKKYQDNPFVYHGFSAANYLKQIVDTIDSDVLNAIRYHTLGRPNMSTLEKIIFISDKCEPTRTYPEAKTIYEMALKDLNEAIYMVLDSSLKYLKNNNLMPLEEQILTYQYYKNIKEDK